MEFRREDRSIPLSLWYTESMLEYFRDMRDMDYEECSYEHEFWPLHVQVIVRPEGKAAWFESSSEEQNRRELDGIVKLVESLDEDHRLWGGAEKVVANEFERELLVMIDTSRPVADVHTYVRVDEPEGTHADTDVRLFIDEFDEDVRDDIVAVCAYDPSDGDTFQCLTLSQLVVLRGYIINAMAEGHVLRVDDGDADVLDGWLRFAPLVGDGGPWPNRGMQGYLALNTGWIGGGDEERSFEWSFAGELHDAEEQGKIRYRFDLQFYDYYDTYTIRSGFVEGVCPAPSWWCDCFNVE
jgi:hypothetical protein